METLTVIERAAALTSIINEIARYQGVIPTKEQHDQWFRESQKAINDAVLAEREACVQIAKYIAGEYEADIGLNSEGDACRDVAAAIRARKSE